MIKLFGGRFHTRVDEFEWKLPEDYAGTHLLKQLAAQPTTAKLIAHHQAWGPETTKEILGSYTRAGLIRLDEATGIYSLDIVNIIELLDDAWLKFPHEDIAEAWECAGKLVCDGHDGDGQPPIGHRGPEIGIGINGPAVPDAEHDPFLARELAERQNVEQETAA